MSFSYREGRWTGYAVVEKLHDKRDSLQVRPEGWTHGIWIGREEVIG